MNTFSKILLSVDEQQLVNNTGWILTKRTIIEKVDLLLGDASARQQVIVENEKDWLPNAVVQSTPKIARGENYLGLPYLLLDYPRCFDSENIFAVRTMFWWGNFFSITLHLSGDYKDMFQEKILRRIAPFKQHFFVCINENQWQHHFEADNYIDVKEMTVEDLLNVIEKRSFIKVAVKFPLQSWNEIPSLLENSFTEIITMLKN